MRTLAIACLGLLLCTATAAADDAAVSRSTLATMGLATMQQLPDRDGLEVRGKGSSAGVWGGSFASWGNQSSSNSYSASSSWFGPHGSSALGSSFSFSSNFQFGQFSF